MNEGERCNAPLSHGVEFDHDTACEFGGDNSLENCRAVCPACHRHKTAQHDLPLIAKAKRNADKHNGIRKRSTMPGSRASAWKRRMDGTVERR